MQRLAFARLARKWNYIISFSSSRIPNPKVVSFSISNNNLLLQSSTFSSSSSSPFSYLSNNPRFFSPPYIPVFIDAPPSVENGVVPMDYDADEFETVVSLLKSKSKTKNKSNASLESCLDSLHLTTPLHQHFVLKIIKTPTVSGHNLIRFIRWAWNNNKSFKLTTPLMESLVLAICCRYDSRKKNIYSLWDLVKDIGHHNDTGVLNVPVLNQLILSFSVFGRGKSALEAFEMFQCVPNQDTYYLTIKALFRGSNNVHLAWSLCQKMLDLECLPDDAEKVYCILAWFCHRKRAKEAYAVYLAAKEKLKQLPMSYFDLMIIKLCGQNKTVQLALEMLNDIPEEEEKEEAISHFMIVAHALCRIKHFDAAKQLILKITADGPPDGELFKFIIICYTNAGEMGLAMEMVKLMESRGLKPDLNTYDVLMGGYSNNMQAARKIFEDAKKKYSKLSPVMYRRLICGYCNLQQFDEALKLLIEIKDFGVHPNVVAFDNLIHSLGLKDMDWKMEKKLQEEMKENDCISRALLIRAVKEMENNLV